MNASSGKREDNNIWLKCAFHEITKYYYRNEFLINIGISYLVLLGFFLPSFLISSVFTGKEETDNWHILPALFGHWSGQHFSSSRHWESLLQKEILNK